MFKNTDIKFLYFLLAVTFVNLLHAKFTELLPDEAYYYMYSTRLSFGYFDHPPMIALLIKIGAMFSHSEFGVRLICVLLNSGTILLLYKIVQPKNSLFFIFVYLNFIAFQALGFLAVPDVPLMFFTALFFNFYKQFLEEENWLNTIKLAVCAAALVYSKYHAFLLIAFIVLSNLKLLKSTKFYAAIFLAILLLLPHVFWLINNNFPSITYHLSYRFDGGVYAQNIFGYIGGQLAFVGPVAIYCLYKIEYKKHLNNLFLRSSVFAALGFLLFFFAASFNGRIEANWTAAAFIPFVILVCETEGKISFKLVKNAAIILLLLILPLRIYLVYDFLPAEFNYQYKRHGWKLWAETVKKKADGAMLVFQDSYQKAAMYTFYTGDFAYSLNNFALRKNQYDLWPDLELQVQGKKVLTIPNWEGTYFDSIPSPLEKRLCCVMNENYRCYNRLKFKVIPEKFKLKVGDTLKIKLNVTGPNYVYSTIDANPKLLAFLGYRIIFMDKDSIEDHTSTTLLKPFVNRQQRFLNYAFTETNFTEVKGNYKIILYARQGIIESGKCDAIDVIVE